MLEHAEEAAGRRLTRRRAVCVPASATLDELEGLALAVSCGTLAAGAPGGLRRAECAAAPLLMLGARALRGGTELQDMMGLRSNASIGLVSRQRGGMKGSAGGAVKSFPLSKEDEERRDDAQVVRCLFDAIDVNGSDTISPSELQEALKRYRDQSELVALLEGMVKGEPPGEEISFERFFKIVESLPRVRGERVRWVRSLGLEGELALLLRIGDIFDGLGGLKALRQDELDEHIREVCRRFSERLPRILRSGIEKLQGDAEIAGGITEAQDMINSKFSMDGAYVGRFATLDEFYEGPEALIGVPNPKIWDGLEKEHVSRANAERRFKTTNYHVTTWPKLEWEFVVNPQENAKYPHTPADRSLWEETHSTGPFKGEWRQWQGKVGRDWVAIEEFLESVRAQLLNAGLTKNEVISLRLYTGPMYQLYNASLRNFPAADIEALEGNKYETTIFTIASGITKLSKVSAIPPNRLLYRGLGGMVLPEQFWRDMEECIVSVLVRTAPGKAQGVVEALTDHVQMSEEGVLKSKLKVKMLAVGQDGKASWQARLVSEAKAEGDVVHLTVAVKMSKLDFLQDERQERFREGIKSRCGNGALDVSIVKVAEKPPDFKGGGLFAFPSPPADVATDCLAMCS